MGFLQKIKNWFGIGGVKVQLDIPTEAPKQDMGEISGTVTLTSKSEKKILTVEVSMIEEYTTGRGENKSTSEIDMGEVMVCDQPFVLKEGETKTLNFTVPYVVAKSENDEMKEKGGVMGGLGKMGSFMDGEKSVYKISAEVDVEGVAFDPSDSKEIKLVLPA